MSILVVGTIGYDTVDTMHGSVKRGAGRVGEFFRAGGALLSPR